ncbi:helix-turn-helix domain-containing protein [Clostridium sporogenes]|uniref:helix-turn-helix domain-containing protein n=1 Tax=Clostridium sporogenes TaxID=1509 RepID=UPI0013D22B32|nr:helix-turn-helix domain-containing protein [Clostridium sporogenes]NFG98405.1 helix-turn-helix domain-containing protein [Clostridium sporogenes]NFH30940.1 helix-turn-helix domain-containing protein [Clostridium sporogenes]NFL18521.1 helix-turn-helix domain-containing protein [Clostridium sporogenes]NFN74964.1 helix-turn-helix domain-containing protein [Clostridium sporogenes]NFV22683.1 helix-turn-helix domain-containing protein [Clostridium sporogenes]
MTNYTITSNFDITNLKLSDGAYRCYMLLQSLCYGEKISCYPSISYIACALGRCERSVNRYIKELLSLGFISRRRRGSISSVYTLLKKKVQQSIDRIKQAKNGSKEDKTTKKTKNTNNKNNNYSTSVKIDKFNDFEQRDYDCQKLEYLLLNKKGNLSDCQIQRE